LDDRSRVKTGNKFVPFKFVHSVRRRHFLMPYLLQICFDSSRRLAKKRYYFEYRGVRFKLVQNNPRKWADHLLTIISENDRLAHDRAFSTAAEFLSAVAWENGSQVVVWEAGGRGWPKKYSLKEAEPNIFTFPRLASGPNITSCDLSRISHIETEGQRVALALFREANASNNDYLSFLFFWQVLETGGGDPVGFINKAYRRQPSRLRIGASDIAQLPLNGRTLGNYLLDDCRHAIAHIRRRPGKSNLDVDKPSERRRLALSARVIKAFAEYYIRESLGLRNSLFLAYRKRGEIPLYIDRQAVGSGQYRLVPPATWHLTSALNGRARARRSMRNPR